jgi:nucleotide-binding universal stress UspA family protein
MDATNGAKNRYRIVIAVDGSQYSEIVLEHGLDQAARHDAPDLHVLAVVEEPSGIATVKTWLATAVLEGLDSFRAGRPDWRTRLHVRVGRPAEEIVNLAAEVDADLLVIGRYGLHHPRRSIADEVVATATCPTLVVGLAGHAVETEQACPECAAVREQSDGERWFCAIHAAPDRLRLSTLVPPSPPLTRGGPLW